MSKNRHFKNPMFVASVVLAIVFAVTALAYGVMTFRAIRPGPGDVTGGASLMGFLDRYGVWLMGVELALLAAATVAAIVLDERFERRSKRDGG